MTDPLASLIDALADTSRRHRLLTVRLARESGLAASHVAVLAVLERLGESRIHTVAEELFVDPSVISRHVSALEQEGRIVRRQDPADARAALIRLSERGAEAMDRVRALRRRHLQAALADWTDDDVLELTDVVTTVARLLDTTHASEPPPPEGTDGPETAAQLSEVGR